MLDEVDLGQGQCERRCGQNPMSGYSLIKADSLDAAVKLAACCPVLQSDHSIEVAATVDPCRRIDGP